VGPSRFEKAEQHFLDAAGAGGLELLFDSGLQGCVADFDGHGSLLGFEGTGKSGVNQQNPQEGELYEALLFLFSVRAALRFL
jgi:hypothetical protein